ncbi:MAG: hypothetical protein JWM16_5528, partial [Verrucomicrobiales bacterium]|nr:hypothetical protein [Verrucomicrobiales bacterium]
MREKGQVAPRKSEGARITQKEWNGCQLEHNMLQHSHHASLPLTPLLQRGGR